MKNQLSLLISLTILLLAVSSVTAQIHQKGRDYSTLKKKLKGPEVRVVPVIFQKVYEEGVIPEVLISISSFQSTNNRLNDYVVSISNVTNTGFDIIYQLNSTMITTGLAIDWFAFDQKSPFFGEVIYIEESNTEDLNQFKLTGDEHRMQSKNIQFARNYTSPPGVTLFVLGATNDGLERIISANFTNVSTTSFDLIALAWHHTDLSYYKFVAITYYTDLCIAKTGRDYVWDEYDHKFKPHPWNELLPEKQEEILRMQHYEYPLNQESGFVADFVHTGFVGYDIKNYHQNGAEFNLEIQNLELTVDLERYQTVSMDVGTWQKTQVAGAQWNIIACQTDSAFKHSRRKYYTIICISIIAVIVAYIISEKTKPPEPNEKKAQ